MIYAQVTGGSVDPLKAFNFVQSTQISAVNTFSETIKNINSENQHISSQVLSCQPEKAENILRKIAEDAQKKFELFHIYLTHRYGHLPIGETYLFIAVSSPVQSEAMLATMYIYEKIKQFTPIKIIDNHFDNVRHIS